jgi:hypothetical protein
MFWGTNKLAGLLRPFHDQVFVSSLPDNSKTKLELEVPDAMVALACCAVGSFFDVYYSLY